MGASDTYIQTLARLSEAKASGQAEAIRAAAQAHAEAQRANAQIWGQTIGNVGQYVSQIPSQMIEMQKAKQSAKLQAAQLKAVQDAQAGQQNVNQILSTMMTDGPDGIKTLDRDKLRQAFAGKNIPLNVQAETFKSLDEVDASLGKFNQAKIDHTADLANSILNAHKPGDPVTPETVHLAMAIAKANGLADDTSIQKINDAMASGMDPRQVLTIARDQSEKYKKSTEPIKLGPGDTLTQMIGGQYQTVASNPKDETPKTDAEMLFDSLNPNSKTQAISQQAVQKKADEASAAIQNKPLTPYEKIEAANRDRDFKLAQQRFELAVKNSNKAAATAAASGLADTVIAHPELWNQFTPSAKEKLAATLAEKGFTGFAAKESATLENRLASSKAVLQTSQDMVKLIKENAAELGPLMGRYNSMADFVGNPPPKFKELAGLIESYSLANMGVHGMRAVNGADAIKQTIGEGHQTPESMIATINGLNGFASHLLENEGRSAGATTTKQPAPNGQDTLQKFGATYKWDGTKYVKQ